MVQRFLGWPPKIKLMNKNYNFIIDESLNDPSLDNKIYSHNFFLELHKKTNLPENTCFHPWSIPKNFHEDYEYLKDLKKKIIYPLTDTLNDYHKKNFSTNYWEIILGYWIHSFLMMMLERWRILENLPYKDVHYTLKTKNIEDVDFIPQTLDEYNNIFWLSEYSSSLYEKIIKYKYSNNFTIVKINSKKKIDIVRKKFLSKNIDFKNIFLKTYFLIFGWVLKNQKNAVIRTYLGTFEEIKLNFHLSQLPTFVKNNYHLCRPQIQLRSKMRLNFNPTNDFEKLVLKNIFNFIPVSNLEGFQKEKKILNKIPLPKKPSSIFSSNILFKSLLSRYCAEKKEQGSKLILGCHGGSYGHYKDHFCEQQELLISDKYLSWGWANKNSKKIVKFGILRPKIKIKNLKKSFLTIIFPCNAPLEKSIESSVQASIQGEYIFAPVFNIINKFSEEVSKNLLLKFYPRNFGKNEIEIFKNFNSKIKIDITGTKIENVLSNTKIFLSPYLGTGYLETLSMNIPTLIFVSKKLDCIREDAKPFYNLLKDVNIFFDDETELSNHINNVWNNHQDWWYSRKLQENRQKFCNNFALINPKKLDNLRNIILSEQT
ncbi:LIC12162 family transferase [Candidatus Pelagibacter communis]|uniref:LIC12162 family transferase n=1 Tax=Pelagibacter ubique TaxID=198252 RepID=UPI00094DE399|nr:LIC12162 family protein [Candidatus Pelagibacter ubique]